MMCSTCTVTPRRNRGDPVNKTAPRWSVGKLLLGIAFASLIAPTAHAETTLVEKDGWTFGLDGRINAFLSWGVGDDFPEGNPDPFVDTNGDGIPDGEPAGQHNVVDGFGFRSEQHSDPERNYNAVRVRSGFVSNVLGVWLKKQLSETTTAKAYTAFWTATETESRDQWITRSTDVREAYLLLEGPFGAFTAGRTMGLFGLGGTQINFMYGHNYAVGMVCNDGATNPAQCGHVGTGVLFPGFVGGLKYTTPRAGGLDLSVGVYDPIRLRGNSAFDLAPYPRIEGAVTGDWGLGGDAKVHVSAEALWQTLHGYVVDMTGNSEKSTRNVYGFGGSARVEFGPARVGVAAWQGKGLGAWYAMTNSPATFDQATGDLRTTMGVFAQAGLFFGPLHIGVGAGQTSVELLDSDSASTQLSAPRYQRGISGVVDYHVFDNLVIAADVFLFQAAWHGAVSGTATTPGTVRLPGEEQSILFVSAGPTFHF